MGGKRQKREERPEDTGEECVPEGGQAGRGVDAGEDLEELLKEKTAEAEANNDRYLRARADLENYRKRVEKEKADAIAFANESLISEILPVVDNLERALVHANEGADNASLSEGVRLTIDQMFSVLKKFGLEEIDALGCRFDPELHHAITHEESDEVAPEVVVEEFQKGYRLKGRLLRPSMVAVSKAAGTGGGAHDGSDGEAG